jgi:hypothetical protein
VGPRRTPAGSGLRDRRSRGARARPAHLSRTRNRSRVELLTAVMRHYQQITGRQLSADRVMAEHLHNALGDALWRSEAGIPCRTTGHDQSGSRASPCASAHSASTPKRSEGAFDLGALRGTRTPSLLTRRSMRCVRPARRDP